MMKTWKPELWISQAAAAEYNPAHLKVYIAEEFLIIYTCNTFC